MHVQVWQLQLLEPPDWSSLGVSIGLRTALAVVLGAGPAARHGQPSRTNDHPSATNQHQHATAAASPVMLPHYQSLEAAKDPPSSPSSPLSPASLVVPTSLNAINDSTDAGAKSTAVGSKWQVQCCTQLCTQSCTKPCTLPCIPQHCTPAMYPALHTGYTHCCTHC